MAETALKPLHMIAAILEHVEGVRHIAVGASSPVPATASLVARRRHPATQVSILGSADHNVFTDGNRELFDCAAQGRIGAFFLSGGQIDGAGRVNLVGIGSYPQVDVRFPGSFGSAFLYPLVERIILFREEHTARTLVERVDFVSAAPGSRERGDANDGPRALVTGRCAFDFDPERRRFRLARLFPGETVDSVAANTGFAFDRGDGRDLIRPLSPALVDEIREVLETDLMGIYPRFARGLLDRLGRPANGLLRSAGPR